MLQPWWSLCCLLHALDLVAIFSIDASFSPCFQIESYGCLSSYSNCSSSHLLVSLVLPVFVPLYFPSLCALEVEIFLMITICESFCFFFSLHFISRYGDLQKWQFLHVGYLFFTTSTIRTNVSRFLVFLLLFHDFYPLEVEATGRSWFLLLWSLPLVCLPWFSVMFLC